MKKTFSTLAGTMLSLVGLYLLLRNALGATSIIGALAEGGATLLRTLQARG